MDDNDNNSNNNNNNDKNNNNTNTCKALNVSNQTEFDVAVAASQWAALIYSLG